MKIEELLTIDAESELRKLAEATLEGPWQAPTELVRRALAAGARRVDVEIGRREIVVRDDGRPLGAERIRALHVLLDVSRPALERHQALVALEAEPELLSVAALRPARVDIVAAPGRGTEIVVRGAALDRAEARRGLAACARFAEAAIAIDGAPLERGFDGAPEETALEPPLQGRLALSRVEAAHLWLLRNGIVSSHITLPETPAFEAAVELAPLVSATTAAALREAVEPHLAAVVDQAVRAMLARAHRRDTKPALLHFLRAQLLVAARRNHRRAEILRAPLLLARRGPDGMQEQRLCLVDLGGARLVPCLDPGDDPEQFLLPAGPVVVLDSEERSRLSQLLGTRFRSVEQRRVRAGLAARVRRLVQAGADRLRQLWGRLLHPGGGRVIPLSALSGEERALVQALQAAAGSDIPLVMTDGAGPVRIRAEERRLPRRNPDVQAAARLLARDPAWAYVVALALWGDAAPGSAAVDAWRRRQS